MTMMIQLQSPSPVTERLRIDVLANRCREEVARYRRGEPCDDSLSFELFRRAVVEGDDQAWQELHGVFREQVLSWCRLAASGSSTDPEELVCVTWEKFWQHFTPAKLAAANGSPGVLRYLKMCARSAAIDATRLRTPSLSLDESPVEEPDRSPATAEAHADRDARGRFWAIVNANLGDERERVMAHLTYELGLKSAEIQAQRPDLFPTIGEVYRVTRNVLDRLKRNRELLVWFQGDQC